MHLFLLPVGFVAYMEGLESRQLREAVLLVAGWSIFRQKRPQEPRGGPLPGTNNPPLTFELKNLDVKHPYLKQRGVGAKTIKEFGLGYCNRGLMKDRVVISIHNPMGELVTYAGIAVGELAEGQV